MILLPKLVMIIQCKYEQQYLSAYSSNLFAIDKPLWHSYVLVMKLQLPIPEMIPYFMWRILKHPQKAFRAVKRVNETPKTVWIEITSRCNMRCKSCFLSTSDAKPSVDMDLKLFKEIVHAVIGNVRVLNLTGFGEFLFHKDIDKIFLFLQQWPEVDLLFTTNGNLLTNEWIERFADRRTSTIFSIDGTDAETHCFNRPQSKFDTIISALEYACELEAKYPNPSDFPFQRHINFLIMRNNMHQIPDIVDFAVKYKIQTLRLSFLNHWGFANEFWEQQNPLNYRQELIPLLAEARRRAKEQSMILIAPELAPSIDLPVTKPQMKNTKSFSKFFSVTLKPAAATIAGFPRFSDRYCHTPFDSIYFDVHGKACPCCAAWHIEMGDFTKQSLGSIFNGRQYRLLRVAMAVGAHTSYCRSCDLPFGLAKGNPRPITDL